MAAVLLAGLPAVTGTADAAPAGLRIEAEHARTGYDRDLFHHWIDADGDGCDTRDEVLIAESVTTVQVSQPGCTLSGGQWVSLYDGVQTTDPSTFDIDHMVPLAEAWDSGAWNWDAQQREAFANDLTHAEALIAVSASSNRSKGDQDPAEWQPPSASADCAVRHRLGASEDRLGPLRRPGGGIGARHHARHLRRCQCAAPARAARSSTTTAACTSR